MGISLDKIATDAPELLSLAKGASDALSLRKMTAHTAKVALVLDYSGSMNSLYRDGSMQRLTEKALALASQFDDDGAIDFFVFDSDAAYLGEVDLTNYRGGVERLTRGRRMGTTNYAAAFRAVQEHYGFGNLKAPTAGGFGSLFGKKKTGVPPLKTPANEPVYVIFITDGAPNSAPQAVDAITDASYAPIFWQFISIGGNIPFLQKLDDLDGRCIDNADYKPVGNIDTLSDSELWGVLLDEYPDWVQEQQKRGQIR